MGRADPGGRHTGCREVGSKSSLRSRRGAVPKNADDVSEDVGRPGVGETNQRPDGRARVDADDFDQGAGDKGLDLLRGAVVADPATVEEGDVGAPFSLVHVGRRDDHRCPRTMQPGEHPPELTARDRVDAGGGLVEQQQLGLVHERGREHELLLHAPGQMARLASAELGQPHPLQQRRRPLAAGLLRDPADGGEEVEVLSN